MMTKYYVDADGNYLGGYQGANPPDGAIEVAAPEHAKDKWDGTKWIKDPEREKESFNSSVKAQIATLDQKRIRPLAEGDTTYLAKLNEQIAVLRAQLK